MPDIDRDEDDIKGGYTIKSSHNYSTEINQLAIDLVEEHCLQQCVTEPTREKNILDLVLTTNENLVHKVDVMNGMSDHQMQDQRLSGTSQEKFIFIRKET